MVRSDAAGKAPVAALHSKPRRHVVFENLDLQGVAAQFEATRFLVMIMAVTMRVTMVVTVMMPAGQQPGADDIDRKTQHRDRDRLVEADRQPDRAGAITAS